MTDTQEQQQPVSHREIMLDPWGNPWFTIVCLCSLGEDHS